VNYLERREKAMKQSGHLLLTERDAKRGTLRNVRLLNDRLFVSSPNHKCKGIIGYTGMRQRDQWVQTKAGMVDRSAHRVVVQERDQEIKFSRRRRKDRMAKTTKKAQRKVARRKK
jgi:hypothetical protein